MATRLMHLLLSWEALEDSTFTESEKDDFFMGTLLPDAVESSMKIRTHFHRHRFSLGYDARILFSNLGMLPPMIKSGWQAHLELDILWQRICFRPRIWMIPLFILRYGSRLKKEYYEELSFFDVLYLQRFNGGEIEAIKDCLERLCDRQPPKEAGIKLSNWQKLLELLLVDLKKDESTQYNISLITSRCFYDFCQKAMQLLQQSIAELK